jgi:chloramphenicol-sensitive protein RarD
MNRKSLLLVLAGYMLWGVLPLYWHLLANVSPLFVLANRILWSAVFTVIVLAAGKRLKELKAMLLDRRVMKLLIPATVAITLNWGIYIWAVGQNRVLEASLGYYMNPLMVFLMGTLMFKERCGRLELFALLFAAAGVIYSTVQYGEFPFISVLLAALFAIYGMFKKMAGVDGFVSVSVETIFLTPFALLFMLIWPGTPATLSGVTTLEAVLLVLAGAMTAIPLILYSQGVNNIPFLTMGFLQYISPTLMLLSGMLVMGEEFSISKAVSFSFIGVGLILYTIGMARRERAARSAAQAANE